MPDDRNIPGIAVVGMAVRTPGGVTDLESFWQVLIEGRDCITHFADDDIDPLVPEEVRRDPHFIAAHGILEDAEYFDADLFGMSANQARLLDPQQRVFLELCWHALEHAGLDPLRSDASIGVYATSANNSWLRVLRQTMPELIERNGEFAAMLANEKDYIATRVAHQFNLKGPAIGVYTACSSSLVAIAQAWYALMNYQCDAALAGGAFVGFPQASGYIGVSGGMESPDGTCRPFDAEAGGTVFSCGAGCVVLKRLEDALEAGDSIHAIIRGVGVNNDGADKASFTAPNPAGQAAAIRMALAQADVAAASIGYVEAHGTGTALGDPIEVAALRDAFALGGKSASCVLGSVKGNIGHLIPAAGAVGLIKAVLCLEHGLIPPTVHFHKPNPRIHLDATPFEITGEVREWPRGDTPRRAGVSSFGVGGTNAHVVLEEGIPQRGSATRRRLHILPLSAKGEEELKTLAQNLASVLAVPAAEPLADVAWTLAQGRQWLPLRCTIVARDAEEAVSQLRKPLRTAKALPSPQRIWRTSDTGLSSRIYPSGPREVWLFPGQGSQYPGMAATLWRDEPDFREALEPLLDIADGIDGGLRTLLLDADQDDGEAAESLAQTRLSQPALFLVSYAMARTLQAYGLEPDAMIGHSIGEYVAACLAGVFSPEQTLKLVARRGALMQAQPPGDMVAVQTTVEALRPHLIEGVNIACYNAESLQVISGAHEAVQTQLAKLQKLDLRAIPLKVSHAFHSPLMEGALPEFTAAVAAAKPAAPQRDFYACPDGQPITAGQATDPAYWAGQIRSPVRFADSLRHVLTDDGSSLIMEIGPGHALSTLARTAHGAHDEKPRAVITFGASADGKPGDGDNAFARTLGEAWTHGARVDLGHRYAGEKRRHVPLPGYPFRRDYYGYTRPGTNASAAESSPKSEPSPPLDGNGNTDPTAAIVALMAEVSGEPVESIDPNQNFVALGLDSLLLTQFSLELEKRFGLKLRFRRLMQDLNTPEKLAEHARAELPASTWAAPEPTTPSPTTITPDPTEGKASMISTGSTDIQALLANQLQLLEQQTQLLRGLAGGTQITQVVSQAPPQSVTPQPAQPPEQSAEPVATSHTRSAGFGASARISLEQGVELEPEQRRWLDDFTARYIRRTSGSRDFTEHHRKVMADPRVVTGFDPRWKEMVYPIVVDRSRGARLWDIDGNEYIDLLNGFGSNFLGYQPEFIAEAVKAQIDAGYEIGPQHPLTGEVSELIAGFTGLPRVALCNTGSEAVMGAMRIARTVTGRDTIAIFRNSYHGIFDEAVVRSTSRFEARPAAPGITRSAVEHMLVLDYGSDEALDILRRRSGELAAIMIEPIQARHPELRPRAFVKALRDISDQAGCALIFDEIITGFRIEPGGAQAYYGVKGDIGTYGKIIGGGLPFAAIAGEARWMDALDGGDWHFGDDSQPEAGVTYFAGTFVRHPLALAAARASLKYLEQAGPELQQSLNRSTAALTERLNRHFRKRRAPIEAVSFSSMWRLRVDADQQQASLLFYLLRHRGLHLYEQFGCFLSTAHGEAEIAEISTRIEQAVDELMDVGLLRARQDQTAPHTSPAPSPSPVTTPAGIPAMAETGDAVSAPMTASQLEKWVVCQYGKEALLSYNEGVLLHLDGRLDRDALRSALGDVWARHEALHIAIDSDRETQSINDCALPFEEVDLGGADDSDVAQADRLTAWNLEEMTTPFDLATAPLVRIRLVRLSDNAHVLHVVGHHLVLDGWSLVVFVRELGICYNARREGHEPVLPAAESFLAYARNENARRGKSNMELDYWQSELADAPAPLALGRGESDDAFLSFKADTLQSDLPANSRTLVRQLAGKHSVSPFSILLSAFSILLWRLSGQRDLVLCIPFAGQAMVGAHNLVGDGVNTLPLRVRIDPAEPLSELFKQVNTQLLDAADHQDTTMLSIARRLHEEHLRGREPLSRIIFNLNPPIAPPRFDGLDVNLRECRRGYCAWDLFFNIYDTGSKLTLDIHYDTSQFNPDQLGGWIKSYAKLLHDVTGDKDPVVRDLAAATDDTDPSPAREPIRDSDTGHANGSGDPEHSESTMNEALDIGHVNCPGVLELIERQVHERPDKIAIIAAGRTLSYSQLWQRSGELARHLVASGVAVGERVGICVPRDEQMPLALLAVLRSSGAYVPLDPDFPDARLAWMIEDAGLQHIVVGREMNLPAVVSNSKAQLHETGDTTGETSIRELPELSPDALAYVIYTSGSTGKPKGVRLLHRNLGSFLAAMRREPGMREEDKLCAVTTLSFDIAGLEMYLPLASGASVIIAGHDEIHDPERLLALIAEHRVSTLQTTPSLLRVLLDADRNKDLRDVRLLIGGEALPLDLARQAAARAREVWNMYGPTETTIWSSAWRVPAKPARIAIGKPIAGTSIYVLDADRHPVTTGTEGEIWIGGAGVGDGYLGRTDLTAERFTIDPFQGGGTMYRTGDLGHIENGLLYCHGRTDDQLKLRGHRIELGEIEALLIEYPAVREAVVLARGEGEDKRLVAYVVADASPNLADALREHLRAQLPEYMMPAALVRLDKLPVSPSGKLDRRALPEPDDARTTVEHVAPRSPSEALVVAAFNKVLKRSDVGVLDNFFDLGGHSLMAARLIANLRSSAKVDLPLRNLFEQPTPERLAATIDALAWAAGQDDRSTARNQDEIEEIEL